MRRIGKKKIIHSTPHGVRVRRIHEYNLYIEQSQRERAMGGGGGSEREHVWRAPSGAASHTVYLAMAPGSVRAALMGCVAIIVAAGGMILDKDQYDKVSRINRVRGGELHLSP
jgi:hypothetical protein